MTIDPETTAEVGDQVIEYRDDITDGVPNDEIAASGGVHPPDKFAGLDLSDPNYYDKHLRNESQARVDALTPEERLLNDVFADMTDEERAIEDTINAGDTRYMTLLDDGDDV